MKKTININLGNHPFTVDEDAFHSFEKYLMAVERQFSTSEGCDEIMQDIEIRIAEILNGRMGSRKIVNVTDYDHIVEVMGSPKHFSEDKDYEMEDEPSYESAKRRPRKKLFRSSDDKVLGGVCAGLASYFGVEDPVIIRIAFAAMVLMGVGPLFYIVLWIAIPEAKSAADRLSMKGEKIDINNIAKNIENEIKGLSKKVKEFSDGLKVRT